MRTVCNRSLAAVVAELPWACCLTAGLWAAAAPRPTLPLVIFKTSEAVRPGDLFNLYGGDFEPGRTVIQLQGSHRELRVVNADDQGSFVTTLLPSDLPPGIYTLRVRNSQGWSAPVSINAPAPRWLSDNVAFPGIEVRLFGRNLDAAEFGAPSHSEVRLLNAAGQATPVKLQEVTPYVLSFQLPGISRGDYQVEVRNSASAAWVPLAERLAVIDPAPDPLGLGVSWAGDFNWNNVVDVRSYGTKADGATDDTLAMQKAIDAVAAMGGGILHFPEGTYSFTHLNLRAGVVLTGDPNNPTLFQYIGPGGVAIQAAGDGLTEGRIGISALRFIVDAARLRQPMRLIDLAGPGHPTLSRVFIHNCTILMPLDDPRIQESIHVAAAGRVLIAGNFVRAAAGVARDSSESSVIVRDNTFEFATGFVGTTASRAIVERNYFTARVNQVTVNQLTAGAAQPGPSFPPANGQIVRHQYWADNEFDGFRGTGRDAPGGFFGGSVVRAQGRTVTLSADCPSPISAERPGQAGEWQALIVAGRGIGQIRTITASQGDSAITVDRDWDVPPDATSRISFATLAEDVVAGQNTIRNSPAPLDLWSHSYDSVIADTYSHNTAGIGVTGASRGCSVGPVYFAAIRRNHLVTSAPGPGTPSAASIALRAATENDPRSPCLCGESVPAAAAETLAYGIEIRDNQIDQRDSASPTIRIEGSTASERDLVGTLVDGNRISGSARHPIPISGSSLCCITIRQDGPGAIRQSASAGPGRGTIVVVRTARRGGYRATNFR